MHFNMTLFLTNPFVLIFLAILSGVIIGKIEIGRFKFGMSGTLFTGLFIGWVVYGKYIDPFEKDANAPKYIQKIVSQGLVPKEIFLLSLILFIGAVGLLAAKDIGKVVKKYGLKFVMIGFLVTLSGAGICYILASILSGVDSFAVTGVYVGSLTSSPGLAAALEVVEQFGGKAESMVGLGYAIGYVPGVFTVVFAMQIFPLIFKIDIDVEKKMLYKEMNMECEVDESVGEENFDLIGFIIVCLIGFFIGNIKIYMGKFIGYFSLGATGGVLLSALVLGHLGKIGFVNFRMNGKILAVLRELSLALFLAIVGLRYGYDTINAVSGEGGYLAIIAIAISIVAVLVGFIVGRYLFKINWIMLSGALCGGMTSTPGLGAAIDATQSDDVAAGYGATYPFALFGMIICTILLNRLV